MYIVKCQTQSQPELKPDVHFNWDNLAENPQIAYGDRYISGPSYAIAYMDVANRTRQASSRVAPSWLESPLSSKT